MFRLLSHAFYCLNVRQNGPNAFVSRFYTFRIVVYQRMTMKIAILQLYIENIDNFHTLPLDQFSERDKLKHNVNNDVKKEFCVCVCFVFIVWQISICCEFVLFSVSYDISYSLLSVFQVPNNRMKTANKPKNKHTHEQNEKKNRKFCAWEQLLECELNTLWVLGVCLYRFVSLVLQYTLSALCSLFFPLYIVFSPIEWARKCETRAEIPKIG